MAPLRVLEQLRRSLPPDQARRGAELYELRFRAAGKLRGASSLQLTRKGLEQATARSAAWSRARTIRERLGGVRVLDGTAGMGGDAALLARAGHFVVGVDLSLEHAQCLRENLARASRPSHVVVADAGRLPFRASSFDVLVLDPDRRADDARTLDPERWSPPFSRVLELAAEFRGASIKLAPAFDVDAARLPASLARAWRWTSVRGELVEVTLWTGALAEDVPEREVVALGRQARRTVFRATAEEVLPLEPESAIAARWIVDPDPALVRSGLLGAYARREGLAPVGPDIAFLGGDSAPSTVLGRLFRVVDTAAADRRRVRAMLRDHDVGPISVKKRGHPKKSAELERDWRGKGQRRGSLLVARLARGHQTWLVEEERPL